MLHVQTLIVGQLQTNCYLVWDAYSKECLIIDPGDDSMYIAETIVRNGLKPQSLLLTHGHFDHILSAFELQHIFAIPCFVHIRDMFLLENMQQSAAYYLHIPILELPPLIDKSFQKSKKILLGSHTFEVLETPGHTPGGVSFYDKKSGLCFTGDTVFADGAIGDWRHSYSDKGQLLASVQRILALPGKTVLYSGHGIETSVANERVYQKRKI